MIWRSSKTCLSKLPGLGARSLLCLKFPHGSLFSEKKAMVTSQNQHQDIWLVFRSFSSTECIFFGDTHKAHGFIGCGRMHHASVRLCSFSACPCSTAEAVGGLGCVCVSKHSYDLWFKNYWRWVTTATRASPCEAAVANVLNWPMRLNEKRPCLDWNCEKRVLFVRLCWAFNDWQMPMSGRTQER